MSNPTGINQYTKGGRTSRMPKGAPARTAKAKAIKAVRTGLRKEGFHVIGGGANLRYSRAPVGTWKR